MAILAYSFSSKSGSNQFFRYVNGTPGDLEQFKGNRTYEELYAFIRDIKPMLPERVATSERFLQLRNQVAHHLIVGLLFDKAPIIAVEVERSLHDMQLKNPLLKFVLVEDASVVPEQVAMTAVSPIVLIRHPIFEAHLGYFENVIIAYREDGTSIDDELTVRNINSLFSRDRFRFIDGMNADVILESQFEKPIVSIIVNHVSINEIGKNI